MTVRRMILPRGVGILSTASACLWLVLGGCGGERAVPVGPSVPDTVAPSAPDTVVASIRITPSERAIGFLGTRFRPSAEALAADGTMLYRTAFDPGRFAWSSSAPEIASVSGESTLSNGGSTPSIAGLSDGTATITATSQGVTGRLMVTVRERARLAWSVPLEWSFAEGRVQASIRAGVAIGADGTIYVGGDDHSLHAIDRDGAPRWTFKTENLIRAPPSIGADGTIYVPSHDGRLYAVNRDGSERWSVVVMRPPPGFEDSRAAVDSPPSIGPDGAIYVLGRGLFAINPDGSIRWHFHSGTSGYRTTPILGADGNVYLGSGVAVTALDAQGRVLWDYTPGDAWDLSPARRRVLASPAIGVDGRIVATSFSFTDGGTIHGIVETESANGGYAGSPWPTQRGNRANTGRTGG